MHARPHAPQLATSSVVRTSHPLVDAPSQFAKPARQAPIAQTLAVHVPFALAKLQTLPHVPQFDALVRVSVSQAFPALPSQSPVPLAQLDRPQTPDAHVAEAPPGHTVPQTAQFAGLTARFVSQPLDAFPSQSPNPALQAIPHVTPSHRATEFGAGRHGVQARPQLATSSFATHAVPHR